MLHISSSSPKPAKKSTGKMPTATKNSNPTTRPVFASTGNQVEVIKKLTQKKEMMKKPVEKPKKVISHSPAKINAVLSQNVLADSSLDSSFSSSSSSGVPEANTVNNVVTKKKIIKSCGGLKPVKVVTDGVEAMEISQVQRCDWITPNSEPMYTSFHDEEWGVPVHDDVKLFELLVYSQALAELSWLVILSNRSTFRELFGNFNASSVSNLEDDRLLSVKVRGDTMLTEQKLRAIVNNAKQILKIQKDFGSFSNYIWRFVNNKPINSTFRHGRQVPVKTSKAEHISKDLMQRGFRCVGPTVVYSFMQVAGLVNDHLLTCFRYNKCIQKN